MMEPMNADHIRAYLDELSDYLAWRGERGEIFIVGGAAIALAYNPSRTTEDIDALFSPIHLIREAAQLIGERHGHSADWINNAVQVFIPGGDPDPEAQVVYETDHLRVTVPPPEYLLAMKTYSARMSRDTDDVALLARIVGVSSVEEILAITSHHYPDPPTPDETAQQQRIAQKAAEILAGNSQGGTSHTPVVHASARRSGLTVESQ